MCHLWSKYLFLERIPNKMFVKKKFAIFETEGKKTRIKVFSKKTLFTFLQSFQLVEDGIDDMIDVQTNL